MGCGLKGSFLWLLFSFALFCFRKEAVATSFLADGNDPVERENLMMQERKGRTAVVVCLVRFEQGTEVQAGHPGELEGVGVQFHPGKVGRCHGCR